MTTKKKVDEKTALQKRVSRYLFKKKFMSFCEHAFRYALLVCLGMIILTPLYSTFKEAITEHSMLGMKNTVWVPQKTSILSFLTAWLILDFDTSVIFSILNALVLALLQTLCAALAAYSFSRLKFKGSGILFGLVVFSIIVPSQSIMLAQYITFRNFDIFGIIEMLTGAPINLIGSTGAVYLLAATGMGVKGGLYIYILRQSYRQLPVSIEEAAYVDGAGFLKTFFKIVLPGVSSSLLTVGVLSFVWNYADVYFMSLLNPTEKHMALKLTNIQAQMRWAIMDVEKLIPAEYVINIESPMVHKGVASAAAILVIAPLVILYLFVQKKFVQGVERSGLGGE